MPEMFRDEKETERKRRLKEGPAILWLAKTLKMDDKEIRSVLERIRNGWFPYKTVLVKKRSGGKRKLTIPYPLLKKIQRKIQKRILCDFLVAENVYGFSGGNITDAIKPHLGAGSILCVDIKNAFPNVGFLQVFNLFTKGREVKYANRIGPQSNFWFGPYHNAVVDFKPGHFSWYAARILTQLVVFKNQLPQGAPTSPKLFDIFCGPLDKRLNEFAKRVRGTYTRYADNIFFSMPDKEFPKPIKNAVSHRMRKEGFVPHKFKTGKIDKEAIRILGLNLIDDKIHNTRTFKRALRLSIHHINWLIAHDKQSTSEFAKALQKLKGQMNFARIDTLPEKLFNDYLELEKQLK